MKKLFFLLFPLLLTSCGKKSVEITVKNTSDIDRQGEIVELPYDSIAQKLSLKDGETIIVIDQAGKQVPYQLLSDGKLIFPAKAMAGGEAVYTVQVGMPEAFAVRTFGRQVPERKDDFAWENDRIAFRMYGPALTPENPSNGVDMWLKRTDSLIINKWYADDLERGIHYHVDNGQGLDCYKVAHTLGAGGIAPYVDSVLWVGNHYDRFEVKEQGVLRTVFTLYYDSLKVGFPAGANRNIKCVLPKTAERVLKAAVTVTLDAGSQLNRAEVVYEGEGVDGMPVAAGFYLHQFGNSNGKNVPVSELETARDLTAGWIALAEDAVSDAVLPSGRSFLGIIVPRGISQVKVDNGIVCAAPSDAHYIAVNTYRAAEPFVYYFGGGWSKWNFTSDNDWFDYVKKAAERIRQPLKLSY